MKVTTNKAVKLQYHITDNDGNIVDGNEDFAPLEYIHGHNNILTALEKALEGWEAGKEIDVILSPSDAYGEYHAEKLMKLNRNDFRFNTNDLQPGLTVEFSEGKELMITEINEQTVTLDGNHPLAGKPLHFWIKIISIREATEEELQHGHPLSQQNKGCGSGCCC